MSLNVVTLVGRAGQDADIKYFESGATVSHVTLAVRRPRGGAPDWFNLEIWGRTAQVAADYVRKGSLIGVTGSFKLETWLDNRTGAQRSKPVIRVDRLDLLGSRKDIDISYSAARDLDEF